MRLIRFILANLGRYRATFWLVSLAALLEGAVSFGIPLTLASFANGDINTTNATRTVMIVVALYVASLGLQYCIRRRGEALSEQFANHIRTTYYRKFSNSTLVNKKHHSGYVLSLVNKLSDGMAGVIFSMFWALIPGISLLILFSLYIGGQSWIIATINTLMILVFVSVSTVLARKMVGLVAEGNRRRASYLGTYTDFMSHMPTVVRLGVAKFCEKFLENKQEASDEQIDNIQRFHARRWALLHSLFGMAYLATLAYLVWQIQGGSISVGLLILFVSAYGQLRSLIERLSENIKEFIEMTAYVDEVEKALGEKRLYGSYTPKQWQAIRLDDVEFSWRSGAPMVKIPHLTIHNNEKVVIEGQSGQGKTTMLAIIANTIDIARGEQLIDNRSYTDVSRRFFDKSVVSVTPQSELFNMSLRDNLRLGEFIDDKVLIAHLAEVGLGEWYEKLPAGLNTVIGEKGSNLSSGQKQRLNLSRAVLCNASLYLLDEPTANLDEATERLTVDYLQKHLKNKAVVFVTHRPALTELGDSRYVVKNNTLIKVH